MADLVRAIFEHGAFIPELPCDLPEGTRVVLAVERIDNCVQPAESVRPEERKRILKRVVERMKRNPLPPDAPRFKRSDVLTAVDTNILYYAHDSRDPLKRQISCELIESLADGALIWQVACEYLWASRKLEPQGYSYAEAAADIMELRKAWTTVLPTWPMLDRIEALKLSAGLSYWDALLAGTCIEAGVGTLYSEDLGTLLWVGPLKIVNPFR